MTQALRPGEALELDEEAIVLELTDLTSPHHTILVRPYLLGQFRIQLTDTRKPDDAPIGHGSIVRQMCTYRFATMLTTVSELATSEDPEVYAEGLAKPWNCEYPGGRIRLDNEPPGEIPNV